MLRLVLKTRRPLALTALLTACTSTQTGDVKSDALQAKAKPTPQMLRIAPPPGSTETTQRNNRDKVEQLLSGDAGPEGLSEVKLPASVMGLKPSDVTEDPISLSREQARTQRTDAEIAATSGQGDFERRLGDVDRVLEVGEEANRPMAPSFVSQTKKIRDLFNGKQYEEALVETNDLLLFYPKSALLWLMKGTLHLRLNQIDLALAAYEKSYDIEPSRRLLAQIEDLRRQVSEREYLRKNKNIHGTEFIPRDEQRCPVVSQVKIALAETKLEKRQTAGEQCPKPEPVIIAKAEPVKIIPPPIETVFKVTKQTYSVTQGAGKTDIVWIVDQSASMGEEIETVKKNLKDFISKVDAKIDAKHAIIATTQPQYGIFMGRVVQTIFPISVTDMGLDPKKVIQVDQVVGSNDALQIAAASFTRADAPEGIPEDFEDAQGKLVNFFRPNVRPVIVIVSDDDATGVNHSNFLQYLKDPKQSIGITPVIYAFAGIAEPKEGDAGKCEIAAVGTSYIELAGSTKGAVFDLCQDDWSESFGQLTEGVFIAAQNSFKLEHSAEAIQTVHVNKTLLDPAKYKYANGLLTIEPNAIRGEGEVKIEIAYSHK